MHHLAVDESVNIQLVQTKALSVVAVNGDNVL